jgi:hypothetical protein
MSDPPADLTGIVNASGFMLQLALENAVVSTQAKHGFELEAREHPWHLAGETGFIDLILGRNVVRVVCECKRTRDANWVFAVEADAQDADRARLLWADVVDHRPLRDWFNFLMTTSSPESSFCMIRGQGENDSPLLERLAGKLMTSIEALADEELRLRQPGDTRDTRRVYVPLVVTTARLWVCRYEPEKIDLASGRLDDPRFEEVQVVRFKKALAAPSADELIDPTEMPYKAFRRLSRQQERTVFVVTSSHLVSLLTEWRSSAVHEGSGMPRQWR